MSGALRDRQPDPGEPGQRRARIGVGPCCPVPLTGQDRVSKDELYDIGAGRSPDRKIIFLASYAKTSREFRYLRADQPCREGPRRDPDDEDDVQQRLADDPRGALRWSLKEGLTSPAFGPAMKLGQAVRGVLRSPSLPRMCSTWRSTMSSTTCLNLPSTVA